MSKYVKFLALVAFAGTVAACGQQEEEVIIVPEPVTEEPTFSKKYG